MSYVPPPPPEEPVRAQGNRKELWYGIGVGLLACLVLPFAGLAGADTFGLLGFTALMPVAVLVAGVVLVIPDRTRQWGTGLLIGFCVSLVLGAGACIVLLATFSGV